MPQQTPRIRIPLAVRQHLEQTICRFPPEHYAILLGQIGGDPFEVKACHVLPPSFDGSGRMNASNSHIQLNPQATEYHLNVEWIPRGLYPVGAIHTHPGAFNRLSGTAAGSVGDVPAMRTILQRARAIGRDWKYFLAPIITLNDEIKYTGWIVTLDQPEPFKANIEWRDDSRLKRPQEIAIWGRVGRHVARLKQIDGMTALTIKQRALVKRTLRQSFTNELTALIDSS